MGLFDRFKKAARPARPGAVAAAGGPGCVCAPVDGDVVALEAVGDGVFSAGILGAGCAIEPSGEVAYAPVSGVVTATMSANHAMGVTSDDGIEVLVHVGVDTVEMNGRGFARFAEQGDRVAAGQPILSFSLADIRAAGHPATVMCLVSNSAEYEGVAVLESGGVKAGSALLRVK